jgi:hypothetical protein
MREASRDVLDRLDLPRLERDVAHRVVPRHHDQFTLDPPTVLQHDQHDATRLGEHLGIGHAATVTTDARTPTSPWFANEASPGGRRGEASRGPGTWGGLRLAGRHSLVGIATPERRQCLPTGTGQSSGSPLKSYQRGAVDVLHPSRSPTATEDGKRGPRDRRTHRRDDAHAVVNGHATDTRRRESSGFVGYQRAVGSQGRSWSGRMCAGHGARARNGRTELRHLGVSAADLVVQGAVRVRGSPTQKAWHEGSDRHMFRVGSLC